MEGSEIRMTIFMEDVGKRFIIPVYQRKYDWKQENYCQLYKDFKKQNGRSSCFLTDL
jgi:uncharacterized protein with ParB-like and HNH nuclease domain